MCDVKAAQMNVQQYLIQEHMLNKFKLGHNVVEATKISIVQKVKVQLITATSRFKKFCLGYKNLDDHASSVGPRTIDFEAILQAIDQFW